MFSEHPKATFHILLEFHSDETEWHFSWFDEAMRFVLCCRNENNTVWSLTKEYIFRLQQMDLFRVKILLRVDERRFRVCK